jgi:hypothetical protein
MIIPENNITPGDAENSDAEDQRSQQDIHSNGFDDNDKPTPDDAASDADRLQQASDASEPSFTLDTDDD